MAVVRRFQAARCGGAFLARYGAIGTAISRPETADGTQGQGFCLRVLLERPARGSRDTEPLPRWFAFTHRGATHRIRVQAMRVGDWREHGAAAADGFTAGFCEPHIGGTLGGWAWHDASCSLVLLTCAHVAGRRRRGVTYYDDDTQRVRRAGVVAASIAIVPRGSQTVDAAVVHPDPGALTRMDWFERIPPVLAIAEPDIANTRLSQIVRHHRWHRARGITTGWIDAVSLSVNVKFMWDDSGATARLEDFFMVRAVHGDWGVPTDSGSLVLGSDQAAGTTHRPVVGLYWGAFDAELSGRRRNVGLACRMDRVAEQLGVGPLGAAPLLAFADWLYGHRRPLDFLKLRRVPGLRVRMRRGRAAQLVAEIMRRRWAQSLRTPLLRHGHRIVAALARCADLRRGMTRVLGPLLSGKSSPKAVFAHVPTRGERAMLAALLASLAALHPGLRSAMRNAGAAVSDAGNETVGDILRGVDAARRRNPGALHQRRARRVQRSM